MMGKTGVVGSDNSPFRIIPHLSKITEDGCKSSLNKHWAVFHECESWLYLTDDSRHFTPKPAFCSFDTRAFSGATDVRAWKPPRNHVNNSAPRLSVKGFHVRPNGERFKTSIILSLRQNPRRVGITFNGAHGSPPHEFSAEYPSTSAREKSQLIHLPPFSHHLWTVFSHTPTILAIREKLQPVEWSLTASAIRPGAICFPFRLS
jgi:hypothetical protein